MLPSSKTEERRAGTLREGGGWDRGHRG